MPRARSRLLAAVMLGALLAGSCSQAPSRESLGLGDWDAVVAAAQGQTVDWWLFGGDDRINGYIDDHVVAAAADLGVTLRRVPVSDTADAVQQVLAEQEAGVAEGSVDLIWINGENFAIGKQAGLWLEDWAPTLPNARLLDPSTILEDFGVPIEGQESPWSRAAFVFAHDAARLPEPPATFADLLEHARANPGRVTYPAPPDFTGSAFVRQVVQALGEDEAFEFLAELRPLSWRGGTTFPANEAELNRLFGDGQVDIAMSYDPAFVASGVARGTFPATARPFVMDHGVLQNTSHVTIPGNAADVEGALVIANLLLDPALQAVKADPAVLGVPTVLDLARLEGSARALFDQLASSPLLLVSLRPALAELPVDRVEALERRWRDEILP